MSSSSTTHDSSSAQLLRRGPHAESCDHNKFPIHDVFKTIIKDDASNSVDSTKQSAVRVLELGAGTGEHALYFTSVFTPSAIARWQATDLSSELAGIRINYEDAGVHADRCPPPIPLSFTDDAAMWSSVNAAGSGQSEGGAPSWDIVFTANTFHIAPWEAVLHCCSMLSLVVAPGGYFVVYGPFNYHGTYTSESNARFDKWLKIHKSPESSIRHFEAVRDALTSDGQPFELYADHPMPENNHTLVFRRKPQ